MTCVSVSGGVTAPTGFTASGIAARIKLSSTKRDCALIVSEAPCAVAGVFTTNVMKSPPVYWDVEICKRGAAQAVFINSGNANACTGPAGNTDVEITATAIAEKLGISQNAVCICSTGVIGVPLPMDRLLKGVQDSVAALSPQGGLAAAEAIMTTDTVPKECAVEVALSGGKITIGAIAKGSGMIAPNMATMIAIFTTDATIDAKLLNRWLHEAVAVSFNCICIDNDMSTSDTVLCLANGLAPAPRIEANTPDGEVFRAALTEMCQAVAKLLVKDGEGATKFVEIKVEGAARDDDAKTIARSIAVSQLCKTAFFGEDPNWGRFACAAGYAGVPFHPEALSIWIEDVLLMHNGTVAVFEEAAAAAIMKRPEFQIRVKVGEGPGNATYWTCDLSHDYVSINADYRT